MPAPTLPEMLPDPQGNLLGNVEPITTNPAIPNELPELDQLASAPVVLSPVASPPTKQSGQAKLQHRDFKVLKIVALGLKVVATIIGALWLGGTILGLFFLVGLIGASATPAPTLPPGLTETTDMFDPDLTDEQRTELAEYQTAKMVPQAAAGAAFLGFFPWLAYTISAITMALILLAWAQLIELAIFVEHNTFAAAYG